MRHGQTSPGAEPPNQRRLQLDLPLIGDIAGRSYGLQVRRYEDGVWRAEFTSDVDYRLGAVDLGGAAHTLLVIDWDDDARFGTPGDVYVRLGPAYVFCAPDGRPLLFPDRRTGKPVQMTKGFKSPTEMAGLLTDCADRLTHSRFDPSPHDRR